MFSTNLIQSNYGDLNIKSLAFDSFKERLQSTMTALTFFISTGQCDCDEIAESNFNYMIAYMSNINYDASKPGAPALSFDTYLQDNVKYMLNINLLFNPLNLPGMGSGVLEDIMSIPDSSLRKRLGYEVLSFSLQAHSLSQECIDKLDIFFADDLFKYESVCIAAMEHLKSKATAPIQNGPLPA
ncbi:hypothetical protein [Escherichia coli]|uniref:hypothetical protein n=1 Tax=Escherichia coli TaxID=562 RepID=UPI0029C4844A|nr:hypothetical protein [Escherichia coli]MDX5636790.1 hypothetical protein [Escherichia coli]